MPHTVYETLVLPPLTLFLPSWSEKNAIFAVTMSLCVVYFCNSNQNSLQTNVLKSSCLHGVADCGSGSKTLLNSPSNSRRRSSPRRTWWDRHLLLSTQLMTSNLHHKSQKWAYLFQKWKKLTFAVILEVGTQRALSGPASNLDYYFVWMLGKLVKNQITLIEHPFVYPPHDEHTR